QLQVQITQLSTVVS
ncbi:hypothetical protein SuUB99_14991, partial [Streptococcus uberis]